MEQKLSFDKIRELVAAETTNALAERMVGEMAFSPNHERIERELKQTEEFRQILLMENAFPSQDFIDLSEELTRLKVAGTVIELEALPDFKASLQTLTACLRFLLADGGVKYPSLFALAERVELDANILRRLGKIVDDKGEIFDDASPTLQDIRRQMTRKRNEVDAQISRSLSRAKRDVKAGHRRMPR